MERKTGDRPRLLKPILKVCLRPSFSHQCDFPKVTYVVNGSIEIETLSVSYAKTYLIFKEDIKTSQLYFPIQSQRDIERLFQAMEI